MYGDYHEAGPSNAALPIPAPIPKATYAAPVFQTFQDRKRAKEAALRASIEADVYIPPLPSVHSGPSHSPSLPSIHSNPARPLPLPRIQPIVRGPPIVDSPISTPEIRQSPIEATLERSDTLASIRSLDRTDFSLTRRPLPKPPVNVNSSRSLDRGIQARRKPSDIEEEEEKSPAKISPIPSINIPDLNFPDDEPTPGIVVTAVPTISVTSDAPSPVRLQTDSAIICGECGESIIGRIVNAMNRRFHPQCFACSECGGKLEHVSSYEWEGKAYCHLDYHDVSLNWGSANTRNSHINAITAKLLLSIPASSLSTMTY
jgi:paxillin